MTSPRWCPAEQEIGEDQEAMLVCERTEHSPLEAHQTGVVWWFSCDDDGHPRLTRLGAPPRVRRGR